MACGTHQIDSRPASQSACVELRCESTLRLTQNTSGVVRLWSCIAVAFVLLILIVTLVVNKTQSVDLLFL